MRRRPFQDEPGYEDAPTSRKVEVFESVMQRTTGQDLYRILWLKSENSEAWVNRRTAYTRSLAVGSITGYLLGVGDRHTGNIMIGRKTGKVIHIDYGDCFEIAIQRDKLPEKVPFRLTRMLRHAMAASTSSLRLISSQLIGHDITRSVGFKEVSRLPAKSAW